MKLTPITQKRWCRRILVLLLVIVIGGHWALLQSVAWVGMLATNARSYSFPEAIGRTFDGQHPCKLCKVVTAGRQTEQQQKQKQLKIEAKIHLWLAPTSALFIAPPSEVFERARGPMPPMRFEAPPTPPPRPA